MLDDAREASTAGETTSLGGADPLDPPALERGLGPGRELGRYVVLAELGSGGMGVVYKAWDPALDRPVALKILGAGRFAAPGQIERFFDEARAIARFDDPALVTIFDVDVIAGCPCFTMEFVDGRTLAALVAADGPLPPRRVAALGAAIARGLHHAHTQGVIHRDVKPANVMLDRAGAPRVIDFGIARLLESTDERTRTGQILGTPAWMAPEQALARADAIGPATDVYGLGGVVYHAATGQRPRPVTDPGDLLDGPPLPRDLRAICRRALAERPEDRYPTAAALADDLERFTRGEPVAAALPGPARRAAWWLHRRRHALAALLAASLLLTLAAIGWQAWRDHTRATAARATQARREAAATDHLTAALAEARALRAAAPDHAADDDRAATDRPAATDRAPDRAAAEARAAAIERDAALRADVQDTRALARYHLARAADALARDAPADALRAATTAYAAALHDTERRAALATIGRRFVDAGDAPALAALAATLRRRFPRDPAAAGFELHELILTRRLRAAAAHPEAPPTGARSSTPSAAPPAPPTTRPAAAPGTPATTRSTSPTSPATATSTAGSATASSPSPPRSPRAPASTRPSLAPASPSPPSPDCPAPSTPAAPPLPTPSGATTAPTGAPSAPSRSPKPAPSPPPTSTRTATPSSTPAPSCASAAPASSHRRPPRMAAPTPPPKPPTRRPRRPRRPPRRTPPHRRRRRLDRLRPPPLPRRRHRPPHPRRPPPSRRRRRRHRRPRPPRPPPHRRRAPHPPRRRRALPPRRPPARRRRAPLRMDRRPPHPPRRPHPRPPRPRPPPPPHRRPRRRRPHRPHRRQRPRHRPPERPHHPPPP
ncbi:MAG: serine/threonine-protein kinase [bacterium]